MTPEDLKEQFMIATQAVLGYATKISRAMDDKNLEIFPSSCLYKQIHIKVNVDPRRLYTVNLALNYYVDDYSPFCIDRFLGIESIRCVAERLVQSSYVDPLRQLLGNNMSDMDKALLRAMVHVFLTFVNIYVYRHGLEFSEEYFEKIYADFSDTFMSDSVELVFVAPLENFRLARYQYDQTVADALELSKNVRIRRLEDFEVSKYVASSVFPRDLMFSGGEVHYGMPLVSHGVEVIQKVKRIDLFERRFKKVLTYHG